MKFFVFIIALFLSLSTTVAQSSSTLQRNTQQGEVSETPLIPQASITPYSSSNYFTIHPLGLEIQEILLFSSNGTKIAHIVLDRPPSSAFQLNVRNLPPGKCLLVVYGTNGMISKRVEILP